MADPAAAPPAEGAASAEGGLDAAFEDEEKDLVADLSNETADGIKQRIRLLDNDIRVMKSETQRLNHELNTITEKTKDNKEKIKLNRHGLLPELIARYFLFVCGIGPSSQVLQKLLSFVLFRYGLLHECEVRKLSLKITLSTI